MNNSAFQSDSQRGNPPPLQSSILGTIGNTPLVDLQRCVKSRGLKGSLLAKLEYFNPGASTKDRIALEMIRQAKADGTLRDGQPVVELTSGNTGTGLAIVCSTLGHPLIAVMSCGNSPERAWMMRALGAEVVLVEQAIGFSKNQVSGDDLALVKQKVEELVRERNAFSPQQFYNKANSLAHELNTGPEIWTQAGGEVDVFLHFGGTGGTFSGIVRYLRSKNPKLRAYFLEPVDASVLAGRPVVNASHKIQGGGYGIPDLALLDRSLVTDFLSVTDEEAMTGAGILAREEGVFAGYSAGANLSVALRLLKEQEAGTSIAFVTSDSGLKYFSTDLFANSA